MRKAPQKRKAERVKNIVESNNPGSTRLSDNRAKLRRLGPLLFESVTQMWRSLVAQNFGTVYLDTALKQINFTTASLRY